MRIRIITPFASFDANMYKTRTAKSIFASLPLSGIAKRWGDEIYFDVDIRLPLEKSARQDVEVGDIAYWPEGPAVCIFFGRTPASGSNRPRAYSPVNVFAKIVNVDADVLRKVKNGDRITVEKVI